MSKVTPCLWFDREAEEAAAFYVSLLPDSRIEEVARYAADTPGGKEGEVMTVTFSLAGRRFTALNGGPHFQLTPAVSLTIDCAHQAEVDRLWDAFERNGGKPQACGWIADRWGLCWQVVPRRLMELVKGPDRARAKRAMEAMLTMVKLDVAALERAAAEA